MIVADRLAAKCDFLAVLFYRICFGCGSDPRLFRNCRTACKSTLAVGQRSPSLRPTSVAGGGFAMNVEAATARYIDSLGAANLEKAAAYTNGNHWILLWNL